MESNTVAEHPRPALDTRAGAIRREALRGIVRALDPRRISAIYLWGAFIVVFGLITPDAYLTDVTVRLIFSEGAVTCILALAFLIPLIAGAYDLAIGALMSFSVAIGVYLQVRTGIPPAAGALITVVACGAVGALSGFVIVRLKVNSFIATLGVSQVLLAAVLLISENRQMVASFPSSWSDLGLGSVAGVPLVVVYLLVLAAGMWFALEHTRIGRYLFATGGNAEAARLSGVPTNRLLWGSLIASGMVAGLAGVVYNMRVGQFDSTVGPGYLFPAIAAVFLGASQLSQRPNVWGTLIAYFALAFGIQGLALTSTTAAVWSEPLFQGVALIVAVALTTIPAIQRRRRAAAEAGHDDRTGGGA